MLSIRYRSATFKFLLAGLLALLVASYSVSAAPTGKAGSTKSLAKATPAGTGPKPIAKGPPGGPSKARPVAGKSPTGGKEAPKRATNGKTQPARGGKTPQQGKGPVAGKQCLLKPAMGGATKGRLFKRAAVTHPNGKSEVVLFHGTRTTDDAAITSLQTPNLKQTNPWGDLHDDNVCGGFYLTDSLIAAAQFACHHYKELSHTTPEKVRVLSYKWTPPADLKVYNYPTTVKSDDVEPDKCKDNGMITSLMHNLPMDKDLTTDFYQYAIVQQPLLDTNLKYMKTYTIPCANVEKGNKVTSEHYTSGQASSANFEAYAQQLVNGC